MKIVTSGHHAGHGFAAAAYTVAYHPTFPRCNVRSQFAPDPMSDEILSRVLTVVHFVPSVDYP